MPAIKSPGTILKLWKKQTADFLKLNEIKKLETAEDTLYLRVNRGLERLRKLASQPPDPAEFTQAQDNLWEPLEKYRRLFKPKKEKPKVKKYYQAICRLQLTLEKLEARSLESSEIDLPVNALDDIDPEEMDRRDAQQEAAKNGVATAQTPAPTPAPEKKNGSVASVNFTQARLLWDAARKRLTSDLQTLEKSIVTTCTKVNADPTSPYEIDLGQVTKNVQRLHGILTELDTSLIDKLDDAVNARQPEERQKLQQEAVGILGKYQVFAQSDPLFSAIDSSGFAPAPIRPLVLATLKMLEGKL